MRQPGAFFPLDLWRRAVECVERCERERSRSARCGEACDRDRQSFPRRSALAFVVEPRPNRRGAMRCLACGHENRADATFCGECGMRFAGTVVCADCGRANPVGQRFCDACGDQLAREAGGAMEFTGGATFADGRDRFERVLGEGAYKRVFLARDTMLDREVAFAFIRT